MFPSARVAPTTGRAQEKGSSHKDATFGSTSHSFSGTPQKITMKTTVLVRDESPHRFQIFPLREVPSMKVLSIEKPLPGLPSSEQSEQALSSRLGVRPATKTSTSSALKENLSARNDHYNASKLLAASSTEKSLASRPPNPGDVASVRSSVSTKTLRQAKPCVSITEPLNVARKTNPRHDGRHRHTKSSSFGGSGISISSTSGVLSRHMHLRSVELVKVSGVLESQARKRYAIYNQSLDIPKDQRISDWNSADDIVALYATNDLLHPIIQELQTQLDQEIEYWSNLGLCH
ncbi:hypothetical protein BDN72DRAFT_846317 [Pluteus cervinus]|uniref:Uncharacterized protein n=1 Tax=Pluteus cervinus TaxID=181527 RepID=A0ACD3AGN4_9AGAR|nr:hypothetical protein BDN72DRAFT_846317 [Pluteus cervinus]